MTSLLAQLEAARIWNKLVLDNDQLASLLVNAALEAKVDLAESDAREFIREQVGLGSSVPEASRTSANREVRRGSYRVSTVHEGPYKDTWPISFEFAGTKHLVTKWCDLVHRVACLVFIDNLNTFHRVLDISGPRRYYFSRSSNALYRPRAISISGIFVEQNLSGNNAKSLADALYEYFGYGSEISVKTAPCTAPMA